MASGIKEHIKELLNNLNVSTVVLKGKHGVGKTSTAREIVKDKSLIHDALWLYVNNNYDTDSLYKNIAHQLSLLSIHEEWEDDDDDDDAKKEEESLDMLKKISEKLDAFKSAADEEHKLFLLVLDDVPHKQDVLEKIMEEIRKLLSPNHQKSFKVLITRGESDGEDSGQEMNRETEIKDTTILQMDPLSTDNSLALLREEIKHANSDPSFAKLTTAIVKMSKGIPTVLITMAKAINYLAEKGSDDWSMENVLEEAAYEGEFAMIAINLFCSWCNARLSGAPADCFWHTFQLLNKHDRLSGAPADCFWHTFQLLNKHDGVHYNELITQWIMEGYFGCNNQIGKVYEQGHKVLMDLIDWGMLRKQDNIVFMGGIHLSITDHCRREFNATARLGLANVFEDEKWKDLGVLAHTDRMIKSPSSHKSWEKVSALLMEGNCIDREVPVTYFQSMESLKVLMILKPRFISLPESLVGIKNISVLVLRYCARLEKIDPIQEFQSLTILEISGATLLKMIPKDFFSKMNNLRSLNISEAQVKSLPSSLFARGELRWLILRECSQLETLSSLNSLKKLMVLDLSGATSFKSFVDKTLAPLEKLHTINLSNSQIGRLPFVHDNFALKHLLLGGCARLTHLPTLNTIPQLQTLDLAGATSLKEIQFEPLDSLKTLDLSRTCISKLPPSFSHLSDLSLRECGKISKLPLTKENKNLESLDLSGCRSVAEIEVKSFQHMRLLRVLNFSKVKVKELPSISNLSNLCELLLMDCSYLEKLPEMEGLKRLRKLNLSGCVALVDLPDMKPLEKLENLDMSSCKAVKQLHEESFQKMSHIQTLNLSDTMIEFLPSICKPSKLRQLILKNCKNLKKLPPLEDFQELTELYLCGASSLADFNFEFLERMVNLEIVDLSGIPLSVLPSMSKLIKLRELLVKDCSSLERVQHLEALKLLEILDLSRTPVRNLPPLNTFVKLQQLLLKDCSNIEKLQFLMSLGHLEILDLSGTGMKHFPYDISELTHLKKLYLPNLKGMRDLVLGKIKHLPQEVNWNECGIFECTDIYVGSEKPSISVAGSEIFHILDNHPKFWEEKFKTFHFHVKKKQGEDRGINHCKDEFIFREVYFHTKDFYPEEHDRSLEIYGSYSLHKGFEMVLKCAECISLVDNDLVVTLSDLGSDNAKVMKRCWLERCSKVQNILSNKEAGVTLGKSLETLWVSNLPILSSLYNGSVQPDVFQNLKHLYLDCCPGIVNVFPSQPPANLESLHVQFCDKLQTLFECDSQSKCEMQRLRKLYLLELPELRSIGIILPAELNPITIECPKLLKHQMDVTDQVSK